MWLSQSKLRTWTHCIQDFPFLNVHRTLTYSTLECSLTLFALWSRPAVHADLGATGVAAEVTEEVVAGPAELVAERSVVVGVAAEAEPVLEAESPSMMTVRLPLFTRVQHGGEEDTLDQLTWGSREDENTPLNFKRFRLEHTIHHGLIFCSLLVGIEAKPGARELKN